MSTGCGVSSSLSVSRPSSDGVGNRQLRKSEFASRRILALGDSIASDGDGATDRKIEL
jgi:hypothetical protein